MIVKNEEKNLLKCLDSIHDLVEEINIVDTGSTDKTIEIAKKYTDRIFFFEWINDFSAARNYSFSKATKEYILWLDADDVIYEEDRIKLKELKQTLNPEVDIIYTDYICSKDENGNPLLTISKERIVRRSKNYQWKNKVHEMMELSGKYAFVDFKIHHEPFEAKDSFTRNEKIIIETMKDNTATVREIGYHIQFLYVSKEYDEAIECFEKYEKEYSGNDYFNISVYLSVHMAYLEKMDYEKAYLVLAKNDSILNTFAEYHCLLGDFSFNVLKDFDTAIKYYKRALNCKKGISTGIKVIALDDYYYFYPYKAMGVCYWEQGKHKDAVVALKKALEYKDDDSVKRALEKAIMISEN
ncbi:glycosyltransferase [Tyzzerella sp. OttesenSCG-928-J15]|nr:glycosyltransferase [Tyzzerella sp. OttesenSCG-928-J15]